MTPYLVIHTSVSLDGKITGFDVDLESHYRLAGSFEEDATLAGADTLLASVDADAPGADSEAGPPGAPDPQSNLNLNSNSNSSSTPPSDPDSSARPALVVPDSRGRLKHWPWLLGSGYWGRGIALCTERTPRRHRDYLERVGVAVIEAGADRVDLAAALEVLAAEHGVEQVRADCGGRLAGALLRAGLVDELSLLVHPVVAGAGALDWYAEKEGATSPRPRLRRIRLEPVGDALVWTVYEVR